MKFLNRRIWLQTISAAAAPSWVCTTSAQSQYPSKPITLLVPQPAGGGADVFCRTLQPQMQAFLGQPVVVDNKGGAAGNIGTALGARAVADGHTITFVNQSTLTINPHLYPDPGFTLDQFIPVSLLASVDLVICANPMVKANNLKELLDMARQAPGRLNYSSAGNGSANHLAGELLKSLAKVSITHIPYRGGGPATTAVLGGEVELSVAFPQAVVPMIKAGKLKALAVTGAKRSEALPDVPTVAESGVLGYEFSSWFGFALPKGTPEAVVTRVREAALYALKTPANVEKLQATMTRPIGSDQKTFTALITRESAQFAKLIKQTGIKLD